jgi:hypothetical protein
MVLDGPESLLIDEKNRERDYGDFLVEVWSVFYGQGDPRNVPGWTVSFSKRTDLVGWGVVATETCCLIPFVPLRRFVVQNARHWLIERTPVVAENDSYQTINIAASWHEIAAAVPDLSVHEW